MATAVVTQLKLRADDIFFPAMALLILGIVVTGFGRSYFLAGMVRAKLPNGLVHVHGAVFVLWIFLVANSSHHDVPVFLTAAWVFTLAPFLKAGGPASLRRMDPTYVRACHGGECVGFEPAAPCGTRAFQACALSTPLPINGTCALAFRKA